MAASTENAPKAGSSSPPQTSRQNSLETKLSKSNQELDKSNSRIQELELQLEAQLIASNDLETVLKSTRERAKDLDAQLSEEKALSRDFESTAIDLETSVEHLQAQCGEMELELDAERDRVRDLEILMKEVDDSRTRVEDLEQDLELEVARALELEQEKEELEAVLQEADQHATANAQGLEDLFRDAGCELAQGTLVAKDGVPGVDLEATSRALDKLKDIHTLKAASASPDANLKKLTELHEQLETKSKEASLVMKQCDDLTAELDVQNKRLKDLQLNFEDQITTLRNKHEESMTGLIAAAKKAEEQLRAELKLAQDEHHATASALHDALKSSEAERSTISKKLSDQKQSHESKLDEATSELMNRISAYERDLKEMQKQSSRDVVLSLSTPRDTSIKHVFKDAFKEENKEPESGKPDSPRKKYKRRLEQQKTEHNKVMATLKSQNQKLREKAKETEAQKHNELQLKNNEISQLQGKIKELRNPAKQTQSDSSGLQTENASLKQQLEQANSELSKLKAKSATANGGQAQAGELSASEANTRVRELEAENKKLKSDIEKGQDVLQELMAESRGKGGCCLVS